jgi:sorbitol/mannitol transport system permease protein
MTSASLGLAPLRRRTGQPGQTRRRVWLAIGAWVAVLVFITPALWMVLTSFHAEIDAVSNPPALFAPITFEHYSALMDDGLAGALVNSLIASVFSTALVLLLAIPAAYALAIRPIRRWRDAMSFFLSTKMMPAVAGLLPIFLIVKQLGLLDDINVLIVLYMAMNIPLGIWMLTSFFREIPIAVIEAAELDGAGFWRVMTRVVLPMTYPGIIAVALISFIFAWNEFLFAINLTSTVAGTGPVYLVGFLSGQRLFLAQLSAAATLISLPVLIAGLAAQDKLVQGLSLGAVK